VFQYARAESDTVMLYLLHLCSGAIHGYGEQVYRRKAARCLLLFFSARLRQFDPSDSRLP
jgi:hypothetical protein